MFSDVYFSRRSFVGGKTTIHEQTRKGVRDFSCVLVDRLIFSWPGWITKNIFAASHGESGRKAFGCGYHPAAVIFSQTSGKELTETLKERMAASNILMVKLEAKKSELKRLKSSLAWRLVDHYGKLKYRFALPAREKIAGVLKSDPKDDRQKNSRIR
jgi:hypothetical protein